MKSERRRYAVLSLILVICMAFSSCGMAGSGGEKPDAEPTAALQADTESTSMEDVAYVLVYNPAIYSELSKENDSLFSGSFGNQILVDTDRAGESLEEIAMNTIPQNILNGEMPALNPEENRANDMFTPYQVGDTATFFASIPNPDGRRVPVEFECIATGDYSNAWVRKGATDVSADSAQEVLDQFDESIYPTDTKLFGEPRFADNGHKVNILFHDMSSTTLGYFTLYDLLSKYDGLSQSDYDVIKPNYEHAIIHVNKKIVGRSAYAETLYATVAHEFQHLICWSACFENGGVAAAATWLNEAMSGYVEEYLYPGIQKTDGRYTALHQSDLIRHGQSLYSFETQTGFLSGDIGVYGSVFLFSEYLAEQSGETVFKNINTGFRNADMGDWDATVLRDAVSAEFRNKIQNSIQYPANFVRLDKNAEWLSKLALDFYLSMLKYDSGDTEAFQDVEADKLLYDELDGAKIDGGGRVIIATKDGEFTILEDADEGLIYVGLDKDFNVVGNPIFH